MNTLLHGAEVHSEIPFEVEIVEYVHTFLIGTVLYITAVGLYQLFVNEIQFPGWLKIDSTEELETNLIGVTVVVLHPKELKVEGELVGATAVYRTCKGWLNQLHGAQALMTI